MEMDLNVSFEDEILSINPEYDLIFSEGEIGQLNQSPLPWMERRKCSPRKMKIISKMNEIIGNKRIGELPTHDDWEDTDCTEKETIALMRTMGLEPSIDRPPDERRTISTVPTNDDVILMRNGHKTMSIFMSNSYFELKPRSEPSFCTEDDGTSPEESTTSEFSDDVNLYEPIPLDTTKETTMTSISEDDSFQKVQEIKPVYKNHDLSSSSDSYKRRSNESNLELSWRRKSPLPGVSRESRSGRSNKWCSSTESENGSCKSGWRHNTSNERDESNWRSRPSKAENKNEQVVKQKSMSSKAENKNEQVVKQKSISPKAENKNEQIVKQKSVVDETKPEPRAVSNVGSPLFKPKELFLKKKAMLIQQVFAANQS